MLKKHNIRNILKLASNFEQKALLNLNDSKSEPISDVVKKYDDDDEMTSMIFVPDKSGILRKVPPEEIESEYDMRDELGKFKARSVESKMRLVHKMLTNSVSGILVHPGLAEVLDYTDKKKLEDFKEYYSADDCEFIDDNKAKLFHAKIENYSLATRVKIDKDYVDAMFSIVESIEPMVKNHFLKILTEQGAIPVGSATVHSRRKRMLLSQISVIKENLMEAKSDLNSISY